MRAGLTPRATGRLLLIAILLMFVSVVSGFSVLAHRLDPMIHLLIAVPSTFVAIVAMALALPHLSS